MAELAAFVHRVRVYWEDTDAGGIVFYANHLKFFERARTERLRARGVAQQALRESTGAMFVVTDARVRYRAAARLDDMLAVSVELVHAGRVQMTIEQQAWRIDGEGDGARTLVAEGEVTIGCIDAATFRPRRIPNPVLTAVGAPSSTLER